MSTQDENLSPLLQAVLKQTAQLREHVAGRGADYSVAARGVARRNGVYGYTGMLGALGTTFLSKLSATTVLYGLVTISDVMFGMGLLTALAAGLAAQGLTAKKQEKYTENAVRLDRYRLELDRYAVEIPVIAANNSSRLEEIQKRLVEIESQMPAAANLPLLAANS